MGSSLSCVGPETGRLMFANPPPFALSQVQTFGGVYSDELLMLESPDVCWDHAIAPRDRHNPYGRVSTGSGPGAIMPAARSMQAVSARMSVMAARMSSTHASSARHQKMGIRSCSN